MNCHFINEHLINYLDDQLDQSSRQEFTEHLNNCSACRDLVTEVGLTYKLVSEPQDIIVSEQFVDNTISRLNKKEARIIPMFYNALKPIAVAASIALGIIIGNGELTILDNEIITGEDQEYTLSVASPSDYSVWQSFEEDYGNED